MATVALNSTGIVVSSFHLIWRSHTDSMTLRVPDSWQVHRRRWKLLGSRSMDVSHQIAEPVTVYCNESDAGISQKPLQGTPQRNGSMNQVNPYKSLPPPPIDKIPGYREHGRNKSRYSIFPTKQSTRELLHARPSIYEDEALLIPPRPAFAFQHQRNSSDVTHATVQIGLRLSNLDPPSEPDLLDRRSELRPPDSLLRIPREHSGLREVTNRHSADSLDVPVTFRDSADERSTTEGEPVLHDPSSSLQSPPRSAPKKPLDRSATMKSLPRDPPLVDQGPQADQPEKDVEIGLDDGTTSLSSSRPSNDQWPLRKSLGVRLPKRTYQPEKETWI